MCFLDPFGIDFIAFCFDCWAFTFVFAFVSCCPALSLFSLLLLHLMAWKLIWHLIVCCIVPHARWHICLHYPADSRGIRRVVRLQAELQFQLKSDCMLLWRFNGLIFIEHLLVVYSLTILFCLFTVLMCTQCKQIELWHILCLPLLSRVAYQRSQHIIFMNFTNKSASQSPVNVLIISCSTLFARKHLINR